MLLKYKIEFLVYTSILFVIVGMNFVMKLDIMYKDIDIFMLGGILIYLLSAISIAKGKWKYLGMLSAFMVWTGTFCVFSVFFSIIDHEGIYNITYNVLYAFCGVFGGIRIYRAWLAHKPVRDEKP